MLNLVKASCKHPLWSDSASTIIDNGKYRLMTVPEQTRKNILAAEKGISNKQIFGFSLAREQDSIYDVFKFDRPEDLFELVTDVWRKRDLVVDNIDSDELLQVCGELSAATKRQKFVRTVIYNINLNNITITDGTFKSFNPDNTVFNFMIPYNATLKAVMSFSLVHNLDNISKISSKFTCLYTVDRGLNEDWFYNQYVLSRDTVTVANVKI